MNFECSGCGLCCTVLAKPAVERAKKKKEEAKVLSELEKALVNFPYGFSSSGACEKFDVEKRQCSVYSNRPDVCSVSKSFKRFAGVGVKRKAYYELNAKQCNAMIKENSFPENYLVKESY